MGRMWLLSSLWVHPCPGVLRQLRPHNSFVFAFLVVFCSLSVAQLSEASLGSSAAFRSTETPHLLFGERC